MRTQPSPWGYSSKGMMLPRGMTLIEVMVTISLLSFVMASALTLYSNVMKANRQRDSLTTLIADADRILTTIEHDIRRAGALLSEYPIRDTQTVIAALPLRQKPEIPSTIVYALDDKRPNHLLRLVYSGDNVTSTDMSAVVRSLSITPTTTALVNVELVVEDTIAGDVNTWQASSAFALTSALR